MASAKEETQKQIYAKLTNNTLKEIYCERYFDWSGKPGPFPPTIPAGGVARFNDFGVKGAVIYDGRNAANSPVSWVLAWDSPEIIPGVRNKVYVTCGTKSEIDNLTEKQIQEKLEQSVSFAEDTASKTIVGADIEELVSVTILPSAAINASFGLLK
ncbi:hypothetical protein vseg_019909 [Gypsophila vaccaria]